MKISQRVSPSYYDCNRPVGAFTKSRRGQNSSSDLLAGAFLGDVPIYFGAFGEHKLTIGLICSDRCQTSQINCFLSSKVARNAPKLVMSPQGSTDLTMPQVRPPKFLTGIGHFNTCMKPAVDPCPLTGVRLHRPRFPSNLHQNQQDGTRRT